MLRKLGLLAALALAVLAMIGMLTMPADAQTPTATPKAATGATGPTVAPPKASAPAPAKTGSLGPVADDVASPFQAAAGTAASGLTLAGMIAALVALVKAAWPGAMPSRFTLIVVGTVTAGVLALAVRSNMLPAGQTGFELLAQWLALVTGSAGVREVFTAIVPGASTLPTNAGTS